MSSELEDYISDGKFQVESVEQIDPPAGIPAGNWYRYIIGQGNSKIEGLKAGTLQAVTEHAETVAGDLNTRATLHGSTYYVTRKRT